MIERRKLSLPASPVGNEGAEKSNELSRGLALATRRGPKMVHLTEEAMAEIKDLKGMKQHDAGVDHKAVARSISAP